MNLTPKVRKTLDIVTRLTIATISFCYIFYRIYMLPEGQINAFFHSISDGKQILQLSILLLIMMIINWGLESFKWRLMIQQAERISIGLAFKAVLGGLAVSVFTPNRAGEFIGRIFILKKTDPFKAILLTLVGSFSQLLVTLVIGTIAYLFLAKTYLTSLMYDSTWLVTGFSVTLITISLIMVIAYFNISVLHRISILIPERYSVKFKSGITAIATCSKLLLFKTLLLSILRYIVFAIQFYIAIRFMGLQFTAWQCMLVIPVIYLALAAIPTVALTELGVRGSVSVFLFGLLAGSNGLDATATLAVVTASTFIWVLNIALPSLAGVLVIFRLKFFMR